MKKTGGGGGGVAGLSLAAAQNGQAVKMIVLFTDFALWPIEAFSGIVRRHARRNSDVTLIWLDILHNLTLSSQTHVL